MGCGNILNSVWCKFGKSAFMTALAVTYMHWYEVLLWFLKEVGYIRYRGDIALGLSTFLISNYLSHFQLPLSFCGCPPPVESSFDTSSGIGWLPSDCQFLDAY